MSTGSELVRDKNKRVLLYGRSGSGKTSLLGKVLDYEHFCPLYIFDFDLRVNSILAVVSHDRIVANLSYDQFRDGAAPGSAFSTAETKLRELQSSIKAGTGPRTVALDSLTFMEKSIMSRVLLMDGKPPNAPAQLNHYKSAISQVEDFVSKLCALDCNVIVTAHEDVDKDELTGAISRGISVTGRKLPNILPGYFNEVWYTEVQPGTVAQPAVQYKVRTQPTNQIIARSVYSGRVDPIETQEIWAKLIAADTIANLASP